VPLLAGAHAGRGRGPAVHRPQAGAGGLGGHRRRRPDVAGPRERREGRLRLPGPPGGGAGAGPARRAPRRRAQVQRRAHRLRRRHARGQGDRLADAAGPHPQRPDPADEGARLRQGLRLRPQRRGGLLRPELLPGRDGAPGLLPAEGRGGRGPGQGAARAVGGAPRAAGRPVKRQPPKLSADEVALVRSLVIHEDAEVLALAKPPGLSSQGGRAQAHTLDELLFAFAKPNGNRPRLIHRLDRDTSGVILTAKTKPAAAFLGKAMMGRRIEKTYLAIVTPGAPEPRSGLIDAPLRRDEQGREAFMRVCPPDHPDAEAARTRYRTLAEGDGAALV